MLEGPTAGGAHAWAPFFIQKTKRKRGYLMAQKFITYEQQLNKLQADKGLTIPDADFARKTTALPLTKLLHFIILTNNSAVFS